MKPLLIQFTDVHKSFGNLTVLNGLNLNVYKGQITTLVGPQGAGKRIVLNHIAGQMKPDSGGVVYDGQALSHDTAGAGTPWPQVCSPIFRETALLDALNVFENIALPLREQAGVSESAVRERVSDIINRLELGPVGRDFPFQLSGEANKTVILARALVTGPQIVLFDRPAAGMDPIRKNAVYSLIAECQNAMGFTAIITSQDVPDVFEISHRVAMLDGGRIFFEGTPAEIRDAQDPAITGFLQEADDSGGGPEVTADQPSNDSFDQLYPGDFAVVILSVDNMDEIRKKLDNSGAEKALQTLADQIQSNVRGADRCIYLPPDKIQIQLPHTDMEQSRQVCAKLAGAMNAGTIAAVQPEPGAFFSINAGFAQARGDSSVEQVMALAESMQTPFYKFNLDTEQRILE